MGENKRFSYYELLNSKNVPNNIDHKIQCLVYLHKPNADQFEEKIINIPSSLISVFHDHFLDEDQNKRIIHVYVNVEQYSSLLNENPIADINDWIYKFDSSTFEIRKIHLKGYLTNRVSNDKIPVQIESYFSSELYYSNSKISLQYDYVGSKGMNRNQFNSNARELMIKRSYKWPGGRGESVSEWLDDNKCKREGGF